MFTAENPVGRLLLSRFISPVTDQDMEVFSEQRQRFSKVLRVDRVTVTDFSRTTLLQQKHADHLVEALLRPATSSLRSAILLPAGQAVFALQIARVIRELAVPQRKAFTEAEALQAWLAEVLTPQEKEALATFLHEK